MEEYVGAKARNYAQTTGKTNLLFPAIERHLPNSKGASAKLLDVGCGEGSVAKLAESKEYEYYGLDASQDMLNLAKASFPKGNYLRSSSIEFAHKYREKFDVIIISMLFPVFDSAHKIKKTLLECKKVLKPEGIILIGVTHPAYDWYMQFDILGKSGVTTNFKGYFNSGQKFCIRKPAKNGEMIFEDYHWTIADYFNCITEASLKLKSIDECMPVNIIDKETLKEKQRFPTYLLLVTENY